ncbi:MAG: hypothetical protein KF838_10585 [Phycisphaeraceae bacterium]|nr:MAG: hypothetical protein KF838_10585 [Phycisphaeraceae bacterium]
MSQCRMVCSIVGALGIMVGGMGCEGMPGHFPGGSMASIDKYVYQSTTDIPQTITLVDTRTGHAVWSKDVPVGQQLVMRFYADKNDADPVNPDRLDWAMMPSGQRGGTLNNRVFVPASHSRRLDVTLRAPGEMPPMAEARQPAPIESAPAPAPAPAAAPEPAPAPAGSDPAPIDLPDNR